jgi:HNH endonuclease
LISVLCCWYCGSTDGPFHDDHVVPRSRGGPDSPRNLVKACVKCNFAKRDRLPSEWLEEVPQRIAEIETRITQQIATKITGRRDWKRRKRERASEKFPVCYFCAGQIRLVEEGFVEFVDQETGPPFKAETHTRFIENGGRAERGALTRVGNGPELVRRGIWNGYERAALLSHASCGPDGFYWVCFEQIAEDGVTHWIKHIERKTWGWIANEGIRLGFEAAKFCRPWRYGKITEAGRNPPFDIDRIHRS